MSNITKLYSTSIIYKIFCVIIIFINSILINRSLGVSLRGEYTTIITISSLLQLVLNLGIGSSYPYFRKTHPLIAKKIIFTLSIIISTFYIFILCVICINLSDRNIFIGIIAIVSAAENIIVSIAVVEDVKKRNLLNIWTAILNTLLLLFIFIFYDENLILVLFSVICNYILLIVFIIRSYRLSFCNFNNLKYKYIETIFSIGLPAMLMNILIYFNYHADVIFLSYLQDSKAVVGIYGTAVTLGNMLWIIPDAFKDIILYRVSINENAQEVIIAIIVNCIICMAFILGFGILGKWFIDLIYGSEYKDSYPITMIIFIGTFPMILYKLIHPVYIAKGNMKTIVILLLVSVIINTVLDILLIPKYDAFGAAWASVISYSVCGIAFLFKFIKDTHVSIIDSLNRFIKYMKNINIVMFKDK